MSFKYLVTILVFMNVYLIFADDNMTILKRLTKAESVNVTFDGCADSDDFSPDPSDCTKFYRCSNGFQFSFVCGPGTGFDKRLKVCNYKDSIPECDGSSEDDSSNSSKSSDATTVSGGSTTASGVTTTASGATTTASGATTTASAATTTGSSATTTASSATTTVSGTTLSTTSGTTLITDLDPTLCSKLTPTEKAIFCDSVTFKTYYPSCCDAV